jgi:predicted NBD/HSP70 family sugar kinase
MVEPGGKQRATAPLLKTLNERTVLETIRAAAPISRAEVSRRAGISKPTVSLALRSLVDAGLVREVAHDPGGPSYGAVFFEPVHEAALVLGLDVGGRYLRGAICDLAGEIRARQDVELRDADVERVLDLVVDLRRSLVAASGVERPALDGIVVGVPGVVRRESGTIELAGGVGGLGTMAIGEELRERLGQPVRLENDVNLAAIGERWQGVASGVDDFAFLSIGTGVGAGLVLRGELHRGHHGAAGEIDLAFAGLGDAADPCASAVSRLAAERVVGTPSQLAAPYEARDVFAAARAGDAVAGGIVTEVAHRIARNIAPLAAVADVSLVVLGGGIGANGDLLLGPIREHLATITPYPPRVEVSSLGEAAVLAGALWIGLRAALDNVFVNRMPGALPSPA